MFSNISMNRIIPLLITISALAACTSSLETQSPTVAPTQISEPTRAVIPTLTPVAATYQGVALPTPQPIDMEAVPPPAWLISDDKAVPATYGTYSISANVQGTIVQGHLDAAPPLSKDGLATASLSANEPVTLILGSGTLPLEAVQANVAKELAGTLLYGLADPRPLNRVEARHEGNLTVLTFEPIGNEDDQILQVVVTVENNEASPFTGEATYFWRLNPAPDATPTATSSQSHLAQAREVLFTYFSLLHAPNYAEAVNLYGGSYDLLRDWNPTVDRNDYAALFENGCTINGLMCLEARTVVQEEEISPHEFKFVFEFMNEDGSLFVSGPEASPQSQFVFIVSMDEDGKFLVQDLPVYTP